MKELDVVRAQEPAVRTLRAAAAAGRLASSYLFEGPSGVGKQLLATSLARGLVAGGSPDKQRRIDAGRHPDVRVFEPRQEGHRNIQVEFLRTEILPVCQYAPFEASRAVLIFPEADVSFPENHPEAANAMLKTLEEPRPGVHFVLLAERPDRLLATIRSRCQRIRLSRLPDREVDAILEARGVAAEDRGPAVALADGRADRAIALAEEGLARALLEEAVDIDADIDAHQPGRLVERAEAIARSSRTELTLDTLARYYRDVSCAALGLDDERLMFRHAAARIRERAGRIGAARAAARAALIRETVELFADNANPQLLLDALLFQLRSARA